MAAGGAGPHPNLPPRGEGTGKGDIPVEVSMAEIERLNVPGLPEPPGGRFVHVVRAGSLVWISGQTARLPDGSVAGKGDAYAQSKQAYANIQRAIESVGGSLANLTKVTIFLTGEEHLAGSRKAQDEYAREHPLTASSMVIVKGLANPELVVEIEAFGVVGE